MANQDLGTPTAAHLGMSAVGITYTVLSAGSNKASLGMSARGITYTVLSGTAARLGMSTQGITWTNLAGTASLGMRCSPTPIPTSNPPYNTAAASGFYNYSYATVVAPTTFIPASLGLGMDTSVLNNVGGGSVGNDDGTDEDAGAGGSGVGSNTTVLEMEGPADNPPAGLVETVLQRVSEVFPAPPLSNGQLTGPWQPTSVSRGSVGVLHVFVSGVDRTYFRGARTSVEDFTLMDPFGCGPAHVRFPRVTAWEDPGSGALAWLKEGQNVDIKLVNGGTKTTLWSGVITGFSPDGSPTGGQGMRVECVGDLVAGAGLSVHKPRQYVPTTERGVLIARALNEEVYSRRIARIPVTNTGKLTRERGSGDQTVQEYVQSILPAGWTVARVKGAARVYRIQPRGTGASTWTVRALQRGVDLQLSQDFTQAPNIIYGRGVNADGYSWANWYYPGQDGDSQPSYPMSSAGSTIHVGTTDSDTSTGHGVSDLQRRINELNITPNVAVDGVYNADDADAISDIQHHAGIQVDGVVAGQTWNALYPLYSSDQLDHAIRLSIAGDNRVVPVIYGSDGTVIGRNSSFRPDILRVERDEQMGSGISKAIGKKSAADEYNRTRRNGEAYPGWVGTISLQADPNEGSRFLIREGDRVTVQSFSGTDVTMHIGQVQASPGDGAGAVSLTVDELYRDLPTIQAIIHQDEDSKDDPLRMPGRRARRSQTTPDAVEPFDGESRAGIIPRIPLYANLWVVQAIPVSAAGRIAKVTLQTTPAANFYVAFFGDKISAATLKQYVGDPTSTDDYGRGPYQPNEDKLRELGFIDAIGGPYQAAGYSPGQQTSPWDGFSSSPLTGKLESTAPLQYRSVRPPWIWVCFYADRSCFVSGRILPGPIEG